MPLSAILFLACIPTPNPKIPVADPETVSRQVLFYTLECAPAEEKDLAGIAELLKRFHEDMKNLTGLTEEDFSTSRVRVRMHPPGTPQGQLGYASMEGGPVEKTGARRGYVGTINMPGAAAHNGSMTSSSGHPMDRHYFDKLVLHEVAPAYFELYARAHTTTYHAAPGWFEQGMEEYVAVFHADEYWRKTGCRVYYERARGGIDTDFGLNALDEYNDGLILTKFIADEFGEQALFRTIIAPEPTFGRRLKSGVGVSFDEFLKRFQSWREKTIEKK